MATRLLCPRGSPGKNTGGGAIPSSRGSADPGIQPVFPALAGESLLLSHPGSPSLGPLRGKSSAANLSMKDNLFGFHMVPQLQCFSLRDRPPEHTGLRVSGACIQEPYNRPAAEMLLSCTGATTLAKLQGSALREQANTHLSAKRRSPQTHSAFLAEVGCILYKPLSRDHSAWSLGARNTLGTKHFLAKLGALCGLPWSLWDPWLLCHRLPSAHCINETKLPACLWKKFS